MSRINYRYRSNQLQFVLADRIVLVNAKTKLNYRDLSNVVRLVMKTKQDNIVIDWIDAVFAKSNSELWWSIGRGVVSEEKRTLQWRIWSYRCNLRRKRYWTMVTYWIGCRLWRKQDRTTMCWSYRCNPCWNNDMNNRIDMIYVDTELNCHDLFNLVWSLMKTR